MFSPHQGHYQQEDRQQSEAAALLMDSQKVLSPPLVGGD